MAANLLPIDNDLAKAVKFRLGYDKQIPIEFQFPPRITTDSRTGTWVETEITGKQPMSAWKTSGARKMLLEWQYVIGATNNWPVEKIKTQILNLRNYYTERENLAGNFIVMFWIWKLGGKDPMSCRLGNIDISYGKAVYVPTIRGNLAIDKAHPVITNIKVAIQPWDRGNATEAEITSALKSKSAKLDVKGLIQTPFDWQ